MTAATATLTGFLLSRIAEDEQRTRSAYPFDSWEKHDDDGDYTWNPDALMLGWHTGRCGWRRGEMLTRSVDCECDVPARVLAECDAKRRIVELHTERFGDKISWACPACYGYEDMEEDSDGNGVSYHVPPEAPCQTLRLLALPFADHPDYREEWRLS